MTDNVFVEGADRDENDEGLVLDALAALPLTTKLRHPSLFRVRSAAKRKPRKRRPRWWRPMQLTPHFNLREFYCKDSSRPRPGRWRTYKAWALQIGEPMRAKFGACHVNSGYRTPAWNARVGGERGSFHVNDWHDVDDVAVDATWAKGNPSEWAAELDRLRRTRRKGNGGIGRYRTFCHSDTRDYPANWTG